jgi:hypothetical protein
MILALFISGFFTCTQNLDSKYVLWSVLFSYQEGKIRECMIMFWQNCIHQCPFAGLNSISLTYSHSSTSQSRAHYVFKQRLKLCTQKLTIQLAGFGDCSMCSTRLLWYLIDSCECQWTDIICGRVEHDFSVLMQELCDNFEIFEIWSSHSVVVVRRLGYGTVSLSK